MESIFMSQYSLQFDIFLNLFIIRDPILRRQFNRCTSSNPIALIGSVSSFIFGDPVFMNGLFRQPGRIDWSMRLGAKTQVGPDLPSDPSGSSANVAFVNVSMLRYM